MDKRILRSSIFRHLDGIVTVPIAVALHRKGVLNFIAERNSCTLSEICANFPSNEGYMNVALRALASQGFIQYNVDNQKNRIAVSKNDRTETFTSLIHFYEKVIPFLNDSLKDEFADFETTVFSGHALVLQNFADIFAELSGFGEDSVQNQMLKHIEGCIAGPVIVHLGMSGMFHKYFMETSFQAAEFHKDPENFEKILDFLTGLGWFTKKGQNYKFTDTGIYFARRAASYGVTVSYLSMFSRIDELLFGDPKRIREIGEGTDEVHVNRKMNVWGSGGAHGTYFQVVTDFIIEIFNQPLQLQPKGILDMGCGNGAFIQHLFETIERHTLRGRNLDDYPLFLVGADYNNAALSVTRANLINNDIWAKVIWGDIGNPDLLAKDLMENYEIDLSDLLNIRTFLDHNRIWEMPQQSDPDRSSTSTGAFSFRGERLPNNLVEENLKEHLVKWMPYIKKNGLLVIELHTVNPELVSENLGKTAATAYDATHGFSDQYIVEIDVFQKICAEIGLMADQELFRKFPDSELATVSINLLKAKDQLSAE